MSANIDRAGKTRQLDRRAEPEEQVTEEQIADASRLVRLLMAILRAIAMLQRRWAPRRIDFEDRVVDDTGTTVYHFPHKFGGRVRWWVVDWSGTGWSALSKHDSTTENTLALVSLVVGTVTVRVEEAG